MSTSLARATPEEERYFAGTVRTLQTIVGALVCGLLFFLVVTFTLPPKSLTPAPGQAPGVTLPVFTVVAYTFTAIMLPLSLVVPGMIAEAMMKRVAADKPALPQGRGSAAPAGDLPALMRVYTQRKIVGAALNEGPAFLALIAWMLERQLPALGLALALIAGVAARFPTPAAVGNWLDEAMNRLDGYRQASRFS